MIRNYSVYDSITNMISSLTLNVLLKQSRDDWGVDHFGATVKNELQRLPAGSLPLHLVTTQGGVVDDSDISVSVISSSEQDNFINVKVGVFFSEVISGCNCDDDPEAFNTRCELMISINKISGEATVLVINDD